jgi:hypothetical protein
MAKKKFSTLEIARINSVAKEQIPEMWRDWINENRNYNLDYLIHIRESKSVSDILYEDISLKVEFDDMMFLSLYWKHKYSKVSLFYQSIPYDKVKVDEETGKIKNNLTMIFESAEEKIMEIIYNESDSDYQPVHNNWKRISKLEEEVAILRSTLRKQKFFRRLM